MSTPKPVSIEQTRRGTWIFVKGGEEFYDRQACKRACIEYLAQAESEPAALEVVTTEEIIHG